GADDSRFSCSRIRRTHACLALRLDIPEPAIVNKDQSEGPEDGQSNEHTETPLFSGCRLHGSYVVLRLVALRCHVQIRLARHKALLILPQATPNYDDMPMVWETDTRLNPSPSYLVFTL